MDYSKMTSPCGLDCFNCQMYLAGLDESLRKTLAGRLGIASEDAKCGGCREQCVIIPAIGRTRPCYIYKCAQEREIDFCADCLDFPCDYLHPVADQAEHRPHNTKVFNSCLIKKMGLESWAAEKALSVKVFYFNGRIKLND